MTDIVKGRTLIGAALFALLLITVARGEQESKKRPKNGKASKTVSYKKDIVPILKTYCLPCHTEDQMNPSELYLDNYEDMMKGGKHGKPIDPSKPDSCLMMMKLSLKPPFGDPMPLKRKTPVPQDTLNILKKWISQGAKKN